MSIIRVGDHVRLVDPRPVLGVGYDVTIHTIRPMSQRLALARVEKALRDWRPA